MKPKKKRLMPDAAALDEMFDAGLDLIPLHRYDFSTKHRGKVQERGKSPRDFDWRKKKYKQQDVRENAEDGGNTGFRIPATHVILDVDHRNMPKGDDVLARFCDDLGIDLSTYPCVITGSGGFHYYMTKDPDVLVRDSLEEYPGLEFKSSGRQVVAPGSIHPKTKQLYERDVLNPGFDEIPEVPDKMLTLIKRPNLVAHGGGGEHDAEEVAAMLSFLDAEDFQNQEEWLTVMMACHHASGGEARQEFIDWSISDPKYSDDAWMIGRRWDSLRPKAKGGVTYRTLHKLLIDAGHGDEIPNAPVKEDFEEVGDDEIDPDGEEQKHERKTPLERMNDEYTAVNDGGKFRIYAQVEDPSFKPARKYWQKFTRWDLEQYLVDNRMQTKKGKTVRVAEVWMDWKGRKTAKGLIFDPGQEHEGYLNTWQGWAVEPRRGDWSLLRELVEENLCNGAAVQHGYVFNWIAYLFQHPDKAAEVALIFRGKKGTGKGTLGKVLAMLCGVHGLHITSPEHLTGRFNSHLRDCVFLFADESIAPHDQAANSRLKGLITEPTIPIEGKGVDLVTAKNMIHVMMATNEEWAAPVGLEDERRFFCGDVNMGRMGDKKFFDALYKQLAEGGLQGFLFDMLRRDISKWHPREDIPVTAAMVQQKLLGLGVFAQFWYHLLCEGHFPFELAESKGWEWSDPFSVKVYKQDMREAYENWARRTGISVGGMGRGQDIMLIKALRDFVGKGFKSDIKLTVSEDRFDIKTHGDGRTWGYEVPSLADCRREFEDRLGGSGGWPQEEE